MLSAIRALPLVPVTISALLVLVWLFPVDEWLYYNRPDVQQGQLWRLLTSNLTHIDGRHLVFNLAGIWLMVWWFGDSLSQRKWLVISLICSLGVGVGLFLVYPDIVWYKGFSGALYGLFAAGSVFMLGSHRWLALSGFAVVTLKLVADAAAWPVLAAPPLHDFPVVHQAHFLGFLSGVLVALIWSVLSGRSGSGFPQAGS